MKTENLWGPEQLAEFLGIPLKTLYAWRYQRKGPPGLRLGRHIRYDPAKVRAWLEQQGGRS